MHRWFTLTTCEIPGYDGRMVQGCIISYAANARTIATAHIERAADQELLHTPIGNYSCRKLLINSGVGSHKMPYPNKAADLDRDLYQQIYYKALPEEVALHSARYNYSGNICDTRKMDEAPSMIFEPRLACDGFGCPFGLQFCKT